VIVTVCPAGEVRGKYPAITNDEVALLGGVAESVTVATNPEFTPKFAIPESTPAFGSMVSPSIYDVVGLIGAMLQCKEPCPLAAVNVVEYGLPLIAGGSGGTVVIDIAAGGGGCVVPPPFDPPPPPQEIVANPSKHSSAVLKCVLLIPTPPQTSPTSARG
jgi:hypothetical protein